YKVEQGAEEEVLVEIRSTGAQPFRCPERVYRATVDVLSESRVAIGFEELRKLAARRVKGTGDPPIYLFRIALRFLKTKGLVRHAGRRFVANTRARDRDFRKAASRAWRETG